MRQARFASIDGLRGLAIALVVMFHAYRRWPGQVPWATAHAGFPLFHYGWMGVELFFLISGFVIHMTLENCRGYGEFLGRRWLRLFPGMLVATLLVYGTAGLFAQRPAGPPSLSGLLPGLIFTNPDILYQFTGVRIVPIEGAFWSLFVEVPFYLIFGLLYFADREGAVMLLLSLFAAASFQTLMARLGLPGWPGFGLLVSLLGLRYYGWFVAGALLWTRYRHGGRAHWLAALVLPAAMLTTPGAGMDPAAAAFGAALIALFCLGVFNPVFGRLLAWRPLGFLGFISYPLYLMHENAMIAMTVDVHGLLPGLPAMLTPLPGLAVLAAVAYLVARYAEPAMQKTLRALATPPAPCLRPDTARRNDSY
jgi:peptidoglycan/LPS O-acetylase OafA/YrhL